MVLCVEDVSAPASEAFGCQPTVEFIRQFVTMRGWYDCKSLAFKSVLDVVMFATVQGDDSISAAASAVSMRRLLRHFHSVALPKMTSDKCATVLLCACTCMLCN